MIAPQILALSAVLSLGWGVCLIAAVLDYRDVRTGKNEYRRRRQDVVAAFTRVIILACLWLLTSAYVVRTALVLAGFGTDVVGITLFFTLVGSNVLGCLWTLLSLRHD